MTNSINKALEIAYYAHKDQLDKSGNPYILHPLRIALQFKLDFLKVIALLHDVVEDTDITLEYLREQGFDDFIIEALDCLTKRNEEQYDDFIERVGTNCFATEIKIADIKDNLTRLNGEEYWKKAKYKNALNYLRAKRNEFLNKMKNEIHGNKTRLVNDIVPILVNEMKHKNIKVFVDIFCGSCSIIGNIPNEYTKIANDKNKYLIEMFKSLLNGRIFQTTIPKEDYSFYREKYNSQRKGEITLTDDDYAKVGWYGWMASFNGRFYSGGYSGHNVSNSGGKPRDYIREQINNTMKQIPKLKGITFYSEDYNDVILPENSLIYCDPPYKGTKQYETSKDFDYERFYDWCREMKAKGHTIFVSEYQMPEDFKCIWQKEITNAMHQTNTKKPIEKLFTL